MLRTFLVGLAIALVTAMLSPQFGSETAMEGCFIVAPPAFVREKVLDPAFVRDLQGQGKYGALSELYLYRTEEIVPVITAKPGEHVQLSSRTDGFRSAKVMKNTPEQLVYREDFAWGQRVLHTLSFELADPEQWHMYPTPSTILTHERKWKGSQLGIWLRPYFPAMEAYVGITAVARPARGIDDVRVVLQEMWEAKGRSQR